MSMAGFVVMTTACYMTMLCGCLHQVGIADGHVDGGCRIPKEG
jgi:hypothetical protein